MEKTPLVLTLDFGTQSVRVSLVDSNGNICYIVKETYNPTYISSKKGYAEQDADFYWELAKQSMKKIAVEAKDRLNDIVGCTITTFRDSSVQLDKDLKPIRPCILWLDQRMAEAKEPLPLLHKLAFKLVGMEHTIELNRKRTIAHWLKENEPETWAKTYKYVNVSTYLTYRLTGNLIDSAASVTGHYPIYFKKRKWYKEGALKGRIFGIPNSMLPELKQPGELLGYIKDDLADECKLPHGIKVIATGSDKACETVGLGALSKDMGAISYGTASTIEVSNQKYHEPEKYLPAYPAAVPNWYNMDVQIYRGYWMLSWFSKEFATDYINEAKLQEMAVEELLNERLATIPPGSDGLVLQPYWGPGLSRPLAKGAIIGFSDVHTMGHFYRAIIEGIAYALREGLESIERSQKHKIKYLMISGGGSQSDIICQITADIFGLPVSRVQTYETTSLGAAIATFVGLGVYKTVEAACKAMSRISSTFYPDETAHKQYNYLYKKVYVKMFPRLSNLYKDLKKFDKKDF